MDLANPAIDAMAVALAYAAAMAMVMPVAMAVASCARKRSSGKPFRKTLNAEKCNCSSTCCIIDLDMAAEGPARGRRGGDE